MIAALGIGISIYRISNAGMNIVAATVDVIEDINGQPQILEGADLYAWILIVLASLLATISVFYPQIYERIPKWISSGVASLKRMIAGVGEDDGTGDNTLDEAIEAAGYSYDIKQDIFYSNMNAWQRNMGYCRLYDEAAAPLGMIIDCEPIYFEYEGKRWMIEFWKGQYDLTVGCEIGVYNTKDPDIYILGLFKGPFFQCVSDDERLHMALTLKKEGKTIFTRNEEHWWLTGFKLGEFAEPSELTVDLSITFKDEGMRNAFIRGLKTAGYSRNEVEINGNTVNIKFDEPHTVQPITRTPETDRIIQIKNKILCDKYQEITGPYDNFQDKMNAILDQAPELYEDILKIGKTKQLFDRYDKIKKYLN
jgi:hypothetical protein